MTNQPRFIMRAHIGAKLDIDIDILGETASIGHGAIFFGRRRR